jgi:HTH-type transcriptional regulator/antitoxin HigA
VTRITAADGRRYEAMLTTYAPRPIRSEAEARHVEELMNDVMDRADTLTQDDRDFLLLLGALLAVWEREHVPEPTAPPHEIARALLEERGLKQRDLVGPVFPTDAIASEVLRGKRRLTYDFVQRLAAYFHVSPALFFPSTGE